MTVYKYVTPCREDVLSGGMIRFTQPAALNDPFESLPSFERFTVEFNKRASEVRLGLPKTQQDSAAVVHYDQLQKLIADLKCQAAELLIFLSLAKSNNNLLMWSHYAAQHSGFVIGFDATNPFFRPSEENRAGMEHLRDVTYSAVRYAFEPYTITGSNDAEKFKTLFKKR